MSNFTIGTISNFSILVGQFWTPDVNHVQINADKITNDMYVFDLIATYV